MREYVVLKPTMVEKESRSGPVKTANRVFHILESIQELGGGGVSELAEFTGLPKSTVHNYLKTLHRMGFLLKKDGVYDLGAEFIQLGEYAKYKYDIYSVIEEKVDDISQETGERAQFIVEENGRNYYVFISHGESAVNITGSEPGNWKDDIFHSTAAGKAILAFSPEEKVSDIISDWNLTAYTKNTKTDRDELLREIERINDRKYAQNDEEHIKGLRAVAVPILTPSDELVGVISVSAPSKRMQDDRFNRGLPELLLGTANEIELNIAYELE